MENIRCECFLQLELGLGSVPNQGECDFKIGVRMTYKLGLVLGMVINWGHGELQMRLVDDSYYYSSQDRIFFFSGPYI